MVYLHTPLRKRDTVSLTTLCSIPYIHWLSYSPITTKDPLGNTGTTHTISAYWLALTPNYYRTWALSHSHNLNKNSPYYSHALKSNHNPPILTPVIQPTRLLLRYNVQYRFLPMFHYLSGSPTKHLSLMAKHFLFRPLKHMLNPLKPKTVNQQSMSVLTRVSNPPDIHTLWWLILVKLHQPPPYNLCS